MKLTKAFALKTLLIIFTVVVAFHVAVITGLIPYTIVWAGKLNTPTEMYTFEAISITINIFLIIVLLLKGQYIRNNVPDRLLILILWMFLSLFVFNTIGNLRAETAFERYAFTPVTLVAAYLIWIVVRK